MSAWIVSAHHIDALAHAATRSSNLFPDGLSYVIAGRWKTCSDPQATGRLLLATCVASVASRYAHKADKLLPGARVRPQMYLYLPPAAFSPVELLKAIDCYEYQSCEYAGWPRSEARALCAALRHRLIRELPGYHAAPWGIEDDARAGTQKRAQTVKRR
ncbi:MAG TPA: hypothetical protein VJZ76_03555 [Thermoanaerobaculia bacterium]|nr:hypothetical protein [Thermoanaerobaculia bacterium]